MWYLIQTKSREEIKARNNLVSQGYDTFLPLHDGEVLFPGYLFVSIHQEAFAPINSTRGVLGLVRFGEQLAIVPDALVDTFKQTAWQSSPKYQEGEVVHITEGPLQYMTGIIKTRRADRIVVLLNLMQQAQEIDLPLTAVSC